VGFDALFHLSGHQIQGFLEGGFNQLSIFAHQGLLNAILAIEDLDGVISLHAAQSLVDGTIGIAFDGHGAVTGGADEQAASRTAKRHGAFFHTIDPAPMSVLSQLPKLIPGNRIAAAAIALFTAMDLINARLEMLICRSFLCLGFHNIIEWLIWLSYANGG